MDMTTTPKYVLGDSEPELRRLALQAAFWGEFTEDVFRRAGIGPGMHVLDVGSGAGDVAFIAARLVGPSGSVLGIDRSGDAVKQARSRALAMGLHGCRFDVADAQTFRTGQRFDAVVGRLVLMYLHDPAGALRSFAQHLRPGGILAFHEMIMNSMRFVAPPVALVADVTSWVIAAFERSGANVDMGLHLDAAFRAAGLGSPETHTAARLVADAESAGYAILAGVTRSLLPVMERFGIATAAEVDIDTLADRLRDAVVTAGSGWLTPVLTGAWTHVGPVPDCGTRTAAAAGR